MAKISNDYMINGMFILMFFFSFKSINVEFD